VSDISAVCFSVDDTITAVKGDWIYYAKKDFKGDNIILKPGSGPRRLFKADETADGPSTILSARPWPVAQIILYSGQYYTGGSLTLFESAESLVGTPHFFNDKARSYRVISGNWRLYTNTDFKGNKKKSEAPTAKSSLSSIFDERISSVELLS
jgi:hypothetical protein